MYEKLTTAALFDFSHTQAAEYLQKVTYPWEALADIAEYVRALGATLPIEEYEQIQERVWIHRTASVAPSAFFGKDIIIGAETEVRHGAFLRGSALVGCGAVVGNSTELKNVILFDGVQVPHFNYVGDSILGYKAHMGAGSITSNVKSDKSLVTVSFESSRVETGRKKVGAMVGDLVEIGCNSVLNPGTVIGRNAQVYPLSMVRGFIPADSIYKCQGEIAQRQ